MDETEIPSRLKDNRLLVGEAPSGNIRMRITYLPEDFTLAMIYMSKAETKELIKELERLVNGR